MLPINSSVFYSDRAWSRNESSRLGAAMGGLAGSTIKKPGDAGTHKFHDAVQVVEVVNGAKYDNSLVNS